MPAGRPTHPPPLPAARPHQAARLLEYAQHSPLPCAGCRHRWRCPAAKQRLGLSACAGSRYAGTRSGLTCPLSPITCLTLSSSVTTFSKLRTRLSSMEYLKLDLTWPRGTMSLQQAANRCLPGEMPSDEVAANGSPLQHASWATPSRASERRAFTGSQEVVQSMRPHPGARRCIRPDLVPLAELPCRKLPRQCRLGALQRLPQRQAEHMLVAGLGICRDTAIGELSGGPLRLQQRQSHTASTLGQLPSLFAMHSRLLAVMGSMMNLSTSLPSSPFSKQCARPCTALGEVWGASPTPTLGRRRAGLPQACQLPSYFLPS